MPCLPASAGTEWEPEPREPGDLALQTWAVQAHVTRAAGAVTVSPVLTAGVCTRG